MGGQARAREGAYRGSGHLHGEEVRIPLPDIAQLGGALREAYRVPATHGGPGQRRGEPPPGERETKDDLNLPTFVQVGEPTEDDKKVVDEIMKAEADGKTITVIIQSACGMEKIIQCKTTDA